MPFRVKFSQDLGLLEKLMDGMLEVHNVWTRVFVFSWRHFGFETS